MQPDAKAPRRPPRKPQSLDSTSASSLLHDLQALNCALSPSPSSSAAPPDPLPHSSKPSASLWKWRPFKALSHFGHRRFDCRFSLRVHSLRPLPSDLNGRFLSVRWRRAGSSSSSITNQPARVCRGVAEFASDLMEENCHIYGHRSSHRGPAKYEPRQFVVSVVTSGEAKPVSLGEHRVDLTSMLPPSLEDLERGDCSRDWSTSFRLDGKVKGAVMSVTFGFSLVGEERSGSLDGSARGKRDLVGEDEKKLRRTESLSAIDRVPKVQPCDVEEGKVVGAVAAGRALGGEEYGEESCVTTDQIEDEITVRDMGVEVTSPVHCGTSSVGGMVDSKDSVVLHGDGKKKLEDGELPEVNCHKQSVDAQVSEVVEQEKSADIKSELTCSNEAEDPEFTVIEQGMEVLDKPLVLGVEESLRIDEAGDELKNNSLHEHDPLTGDVVSTQTDAGDGGKKTQPLGEMTLGDLDSAFHGLSILESSTPVDSPKSVFNDSVFHGLSMLAPTVPIHHPEAELEDTTCHALSATVTCVPLPEMVENSVSNEMEDHLSMLAPTVPIHHPEAELEDTTCHALFATVTCVPPPEMVENSVSNETEDHPSSGLSTTENFLPIHLPSAELDDSVSHGSTETFVRQEKLEKSASGEFEDYLPNGLSNTETFVPICHPQEEFEDSVSHCLSTTETFVSPQMKLENSVSDELEDYVSNGLSTTEMTSVPIYHPRAELEDCISNGLSTTRASVSPRAKLETESSGELSVENIDSHAKQEFIVTHEPSIFEPSEPGAFPEVNSGSTVFLERSTLKLLELVHPPQAEFKKSVYDDDLPALVMPKASESKLDDIDLSDDSEMNSGCNSGRISKSHSYDESVASEFLDNLSMEQSPPLGSSSNSEPESPRERLLKQFSKDDAWRQFASASSSDVESPKGRLLRQFQEECAASGIDILCPDSGSGKESDWDEEVDLGLIVQAAESEKEKLEQEMISKARAKLLEDAETEVLMREMGLHEKAFRNSPATSRYGFGSPIDFPNEDPLELPPLGEGLGSFIQTRDGGFLRSMSPSLFKSAKNNGSLIMQVSSPIVVPAELGSDIMDILQGLASIGIEKLSMQARKLMPLEDVTGKSMQQVAWEALPSLEANESMVDSDFSRSFIDDGRRKKTHYSRNEDPDSEYVSLEDLAPLAMDKIEALSIEGLRIQSGMSDGDAPANIFAQSLGEISALKGKGAENTIGLEGSAALQLLDVNNTDDEVDGLMGLSLTLDEWMRLDSGLVDEKEVGNERTTKILAAHHAKSADLVTGGWEGDKRGGKGSGKRWGLLGNNFTVALMVQLRDPMRDYEPVGTPMLSLIQVERVFVPPKPKICCTVSDRGNIVEYDDESEKKPASSKPPLEKKEEEAPVAQFKIAEVHVAGLKQEPSKKITWGNPAQQPSGSRWLLATGMGKNNKHPFMKSKAASKPSQSTTTVPPGDNLWSLSSRIFGFGGKWKEPAAVDSHVRNPNVIFPNQTPRLH